MWITQEPKKVALWKKRHFEEKNGECAACLKYSVLVFVKKIYKMQHLEGSGAPVLYIGRKVLKGFFSSSAHVFCDITSNCTSTALQSVCVLKTEKSTLCRRLCLSSPAAELMEFSLCVILHLLQTLLPARLVQWPGIPRTQRVCILVLQLGEYPAGNLLRSPADTSRLPSCSYLRAVCDYLATLFSRPFHWQS
jgi:hypothetical protein